MPAENGFVPTPPVVADYVATTAFDCLRPSEADDGRVLFPGLGTGRLFDAVQRYCTEGEGWRSASRFEHDLPECVGVENDPERIEDFHEHHGGAPITVHETDFLLDPPAGKFEWIVANPPFMRYSRIDSSVRSRYREEFELGAGKPGLHVLFLEQAYDLLAEGGWLTFILPVSDFLNVSTQPFRDFLRTRHVSPIRYLPPQTFDEAIEVVVIGMEKTTEIGAKHLWLESLYAGEVQEIVRGLGIDDVEPALDTYYSEHRHTKRILDRTDRKDRNLRKTESGELVSDEPSRQLSFEQFS